MNKVLFLCIHNSARSQMAEAYLKKFGGNQFVVESAGIESGTLNPFAVEAMVGDGIDISGNKTKSVFDFHKEGRAYDYVITVCDEGNAARCPVFPGLHKKLHWNFEDPSSVNGTPEEKLAVAVKVRNQIKAKVLEFIKDAGY
ncbi:MAG: arsenate reductase ArsC [Bacteroidetes bacterium]|nr:arsenate reductase ArsC [Bacteroidota bacterium]